MAERIKDIESFRDLYPFESHFARIGGFRYHYVDEGAGDPVVMVHGNPTWSFYFRSLIKGLSGTHRTIAPDHMGCGLSEVPSATGYGYRLIDRVNDLDRFIDGLDLDRPVTLIVHDWGGAIGLSWAVRNPERIARLVVLNTAAFLMPVGKRLPLRLRLIRDVPPLAVPLVQGLNAFAGGALYMAPRRPLAPKVKRGLVAPYDTWHNRLATLKFVQDIPIRPGDPSYAVMAETDRLLGTLSHVPMLVCWGKHDFVFDLDYLAEWRRRFPKAEVHLLPEAGHYLLEDAPDEILGHVRAFLAAHPLSR